MKLIYGTTVARKKAKVGKEDKVSEETFMFTTKKKKRRYF